MKIYRPIHSLDSMTADLGIFLNIDSGKWKFQCKCGVRTAYIFSSYQVAEAIGRVHYELASNKEAGIE